jgi:hypothetical protein
MLDLVERNLRMVKSLRGLNNLDEYQSQILMIRSKINKIKLSIEKRKENINIHGYQSRERIIDDNKIRASIDDCEEELNTVGIIMRKKAAKYSPEDLKNRSLTIDLLRKNLLLLRDDIIGDNKADVSIDDDAPKKIFGDYHDTDEGHASPKDVHMEMKSDEENKYVDRELTDQEQIALEKFKKNDEELDLILEKVIVGLGQLEDKGQKLNQQINKQNEMLKQTNKKVERNNMRLTQQNNALKDVLIKIRSTNKLCCDLCLALTFLGLIGVIIAIVSA